MFKPLKAIQVWAEFTRTHDNEFDALEYALAVDRYKLQAPVDISLSDRFLASACIACNRETYRDRRKALVEKAQSGFHDAGVDFLGPLLLGSTRPSL